MAYQKDRSELALKIELLFHKLPESLLEQARVLGPEQMWKLASEMNSAYNRGCLYTIDALNRSIQRRLQIQQKP